MFMLCFRQDLRETQDFLVALVFLEIPEKLDLLVSDHSGLLCSTKLKCSTNLPLIIPLLTFDLQALLVTLV